MAAVIPRAPADEFGSRLKTATALSKTNCSAARSAAGSNVAAGSPNGSAAAGPVLVVDAGDVGPTVVEGAPVQLTQTTSTATSSRNRRAEPSMFLTPRLTGPPQLWVTATRLYRRMWLVRLPSAPNHDGASGITENWLENTMVGALP